MARREYLRLRAEMLGTSNPLVDSDELLRRYAERPWHWFAETPELINRVDPTGHCIWCAGAILGGAASLAGYLVSSTATGQTPQLDQALIAVGTGAVSGALCTGGVLTACVAVTAGLSALQYQLSPGAKTPRGYVVATLGGALAGRFTYSKGLGYPYESRFARPLLDDMSGAIRNERAALLALNFTRSFVAAGGLGMLTTDAQAAVAIAAEAGTLTTGASGK